MNLDGLLSVCVDVECMGVVVGDIFTESDAIYLILDSMEYFLILSLIFYYITLSFRSIL
jgi:hypothetical protein